MRGLVECEGEEGAGCGKGEETRGGVGEGVGCGVGGRVDLCCAMRVSSVRTWLSICGGRCVSVRWSKFSRREI